jgi:hypothetical protein
MHGAVLVCAVCVLLAPAPRSTSCMSRISGARETHPGTATRRHAPERLRRADPRHAHGPWKEPHYPAGCDLGHPPPLEEVVVPDPGRRCAAAAAAGQQRRERGGADAWRGDRPPRVLALIRSGSPPGLNQRLASKLA